MLAEPGIMDGVYTPTEREQIECMKGISCNFGICSECYFDLTGLKGMIGISEEGVDEIKDLYADVYPDDWD